MMIEMLNANQRRRSSVTTIALAGAVAAGIASLIGCSPSNQGSGSPFASREEVAQATADCLIERGWDVTVTRDGGISVEIPSEQYDSYLEAQQQCRSGTGVEDMYKDFVVTDDMVEEVYVLQIDTLKCLRGQGFDGLSDPPTLQAYLDAGAKWTPYAELPMDISEDEWFAIQEECPQPSISPFDE